MRLEHSCFISYPRIDNELVERVVTELNEAISAQLEIFEDPAPPSFLDRGDIEVGEEWDARLARNLCESASMVLVFAPAFFSERNLSGAREFLAMQQLEKQRLEFVPEAQGRGLIIPVILRGGSRLPPSLQSRQAIDLSQFMIFDHELSKNPVYAVKIQEIARQVYWWYRALDSLPKEQGIDCKNFTLPSRAETLSWLHEEPAPPKVSFPKF